MKRTCSDSRFEIWSSSYVNLPETREEQDKYVHIIQIEVGADEDTYLVEVVDCPLPPGVSNVVASPIIPILSAMAAKRLDDTG